MNDKELKIYFEWDIIYWARAMKIWEKHLDKKRECYALEIGSRGGGLSLMLAKEYDMKVICSDLESPEKTAHLLHTQYQTKYKIQYESIDCTQIPYPDNTFDLIVFKSVIGALSTSEKQQIAFEEIFRVLKPSGVLLFAENLKASILHMYLRKKFNRWSEYWRYPNLSEIRQFLNKFSEVQINTTGFLANFSRSQLTVYFDFILEKLLPKSLRYIVFGATIK